MRAKSASLPNPFIKVGGGAPDLTGITAVFNEPNGKCRSETYTHLPSILQVSSGAESRAVPYATLQLSDTGIGAPPSSGTPRAIELPCPSPPGRATPTRTRRPSVHTL